MKSFNYKKLAQLFIFSATIILSSCGKDDDQTTPELTKNTSGVYVAGRENNGILDIAILWKDGVATKITDGTKAASAYSVFVTDKDVYVSGYEQNASKNRTIAKVWKNGVATNLTDGTNNASANSIFVYGDDVYAAGQESNGTVTVAKVWKNGVVTNLTDGTKIASANSIYVLNGKVFVTGFEDDGVRNVAKVWQDGIQLMVLGNNAGGSRGMGIAAFGTNVYVAGFQDNGTRYISKLWHNGAEYIQNNNANANANGNGVFVNGTDVYVAGDEYNGSLVTAKYWLNSFSDTGIPISKTTVNLSTNSSSANSIFAKGEDVFVAGYEYDSGRYLPVLWKNGTSTALSNATHGGNANAVFVK